MRNATGPVPATNSFQFRWKLLALSVSGLSLAPSVQAEDAESSAAQQEGWIIDETGQVAPPESPNVYPGFVDLNGYYDSRSFLTLTVNVLATMPYGLSYFSLVNFFAPVGGDPTTDQTLVYTEQNLTWQPSSKVPVGANFQWVMGSPGADALFRLGPVWWAADTPVIEELFDWLHLDYFLILHAVQLNTVDNDGWQIQLEHVYRWDILPETLDGRLYLSGFLDHNLWVSGAEKDFGSKLVTELQLGVRLIGSFYAIGEFRLNEFFPENKQTGFGGGLEYVVPFTLTGGG